MFNSNKNLTSVTYLWHVETAILRYDTTVNTYLFNDVLITFQSNLHWCWIYGQGTNSSGSLK